MSTLRACHNGHKRSKRSTPIHAVRTRSTETVVGRHDVEVGFERLFGCPMSPSSNVRDVAIPGVFLSRKTCTGGMRNRLDNDVLRSIP